MNSVRLAVVCSLALTLCGLFSPAFFVVALREMLDSLLYALVVLGDFILLKLFWRFFCWLTAWASCTAFSELAELLLEVDAMVPRMPELPPACCSSALTPSAPAQAQITSPMQEPSPIRKAGQAPRSIAVRTIMTFTTPSSMLIEKARSAPRTKSSTATRCPI